MRLKTDETYFYAQAVKYKFSRAAIGWEHEISADSKNIPSAFSEICDLVQ